MGKQIFYRVKRTMTILLLVYLLVSLTAASASVWSSTGKEKTTSEKGTNSTVIGNG